MNKELGWEEVLDKLRLISVRNDSDEVRRLAETLFERIRGQYYNAEFKETLSYIQALELIQRIDNESKSIGKVLEKKEQG